MHVKVSHIKIKTIDDIRDNLKKSKPLSSYKKGTVIHAKQYSYTLTELPGKNFDSELFFSTEGVFTL